MTDSWPEIDQFGESIIQFYLPLMNKEDKLRMHNSLMKVIRAIEVQLGQDD